MAKTSASIRVLLVLRALRGQTLHGLSNAEIARALGETPVNISRALADLEAVGFATRLETGRWAHGVALLQIAQAHANAMAAAQERILEINSRVAAGAAR